MAFLFTNAPILGAFIDFVIYAILTWLRVSPVSAHVVSFACGAVLYYGYSFSFRAILKNEERWNVSQVLYVIGFAGMILALRGGIVYTGAIEVDLHPILAYLPALLSTVLCNLLYIRFVHAASEDTLRHFTFFMGAAGVFMALVRLLYLGAVELIPEEAYYRLYATHLSPGYIDHPPMVGWLIALGMRCFGMNEFGVRFFGWLASLGGALFVGLLHFRLFGRRGLLITAVLASCIPYSFGAGFFMSPDAGLFLFWSASLYFIHRALESGETSDWAGAGAALGLGMLSKYTIVLLLLPTAVLMAAVPVWRINFKRTGPYAAAAIALLLFSPVVYWNARNGWASFAFQSTRRFNSADHFSLHQLLLDMICLVTPSIFAAVMALLVQRRLRASFERRAYLFCVFFFVLPASVFVAYSVRHVPKLNWTGPAFISMLPLVGAWFIGIISDFTAAPRSSRLIIRSVQPVFVIWMASAGLALHYLGAGLPLVPYSEKMHRIIGWRSLAGALSDISNRVAAEVGEKPVISGMDKHNIASEVAFYMDKAGGSDQPIASRNLIGDEALMFRFWADPQSFIGKTVILVAGGEGDLADAKVLEYFDRVGPVTSIPLSTGWSKTKTYFYRVGYRYKGTVVSVKPEERWETPMPEPQFTPAPPAINQS